jgi:hypothetical protein
MFIMNEVFNLEIKDTVSLFDIPDSCRFIPRSRNEVFPISRKVERIDFLHVSLEEGADALVLDVPDLLSVLEDWMQVTGTHPNLTIFSACCEVFAIGGETDTADVEVSGALSGFIKENTVCQYS